MSKQYLKEVVGGVTYRGVALIGTPETSPYWSIEKETETSTLRPLNAKGFVSSDEEFKWSDRASLTYSTTNVRPVPTLTSVTIQSNNANTTLAKTGDLVTVSFTASTPLESAKVFICKHLADVSIAPNGTDATATYVVSAGDAEDDVIPISIDFVSAIGVEGVRVSATTDASSVTVSNTAPIAGTVHIQSDFVANPLFAKVGSVVTLTLSSSKDLKSKPSVVICGHAINPSAVTSTSPRDWSATYTLQESDTAGQVTFSVKGYDLVGNYIEARKTTDGSSVSFDKTYPRIKPVTIYSSGYYKWRAYVGNSVYVKIVSDDPLSTTTKPTFTINGHAIDPSLVVMGDTSKVWTARYVMADSDTQGNVTFTINGQDVLGNAFPEISQTTDGSYVYFNNKPKPVSVGIASSNATPTVAHEGDTVTVTLVMSEDVMMYQSTIKGLPAVAIRGIDSKHWTIQRTMLASESDGAVTFSVRAIDMTGLLSNVISATTDGSVVGFTTLPKVTSVSIQCADVPGQTEIGWRNQIKITVLGSKIDLPRDDGGGGCLFPENHIALPSYPAQTPPQNTQTGIFNKSAVSGGFSVTTSAQNAVQGSGNVQFQITVPTIGGFPDIVVTATTDGTFLHFNRDMAAPAKQSEDFSSVTQFGQTTTGKMVFDMTVSNPLYDTEITPQIVKAGTNTVVGSISCPDNEWTSELRFSMTTPTQLEMGADSQIQVRAKPKGQNGNRVADWVYSNVISLTPGTTVVNSVSFYSTNATPTTYTNGDTARLDILGTGLIVQTDMTKVLLGEYVGEGFPPIWYQANEMVVIPGGLRCNWMAGNLRSGPLSFQVKISDGAGGEITLTATTDGSHITAVHDDRVAQKVSENLATLDTFGATGTGTMTFDMTVWAVREVEFVKYPGHTSTGGGTVTATPNFTDTITLNWTAPTAAQMGGVDTDVQIRVKVANLLNNDSDWIYSAPYVLF